VLGGANREKAACQADRSAAHTAPASTAKEARPINEERFPKVWDEQRVKRFIAELDARTDEEWIAEGEVAADNGDQAAIAVCKRLLPAIWRLLRSGYLRQAKCEIC
jgi:hypothetical protein